MRQAQVEVRERYTGELTIEYKQRPLAYTIYQKQEQQQGKVIESKLLQPAAARAAARPKQKQGPVPSTPWRPLLLQQELYASKRASWRTLYLAQVEGDISTLRIRVTFLLGVYRFIQFVDFHGIRHILPRAYKD